MNVSLIAGLALLAVTACTHKVQIEPSDKPFVVNMNLKIDHEIKMKIEEDNQDLLNLEKTVRSKKKG
ncbi:YnbE family lipoprotein [bacterium]|nr:YnbE family lipoprotein [bacterium]